MAKILAIGAHPDDIEYYAGGTLAKRISGGDSVIFVVATDGRNGSHKGISPSQVSKIRRLEQLKAAQEIGAQKVIHLKYKDGGLESKIKKLKKDLLKILIEERPEIVFSFDPHKQHMIHDDFHPDHRTISLAALDVILIDSTLPAKAKAPLERIEIFLYNSYQANRKVDISNYLVKKKAAIAKFESQATKLRLDNNRFEKFRVYTKKDE